MSEPTTTTWRQARRRRSGWCCAPTSPSHPTGAPCSISNAGSPASGLIAIAGVDTRRLTRLLRTAGAQDGALVHTSEPEAIDEAQLIAKARAWPGLEGMDLAKEVSCRQVYDWTETAWDFGSGAYGTLSAPHHHVVAVD